MGRPTADALREEVDELYMMEICERSMAMAIEYEGDEMHNPLGGGWSYSWLHPPPINIFFTISMVFIFLSFA